MEEVSELLGHCLQGYMAASPKIQAGLFAQVYNDEIQHHSYFSKSIIIQTESPCVSVLRFLDPGPCAICAHSIWIQAEEWI